MSLNTAHTNGGVLIYSGERILLFSEGVTIQFHGQDGEAFKGSKTGRIYLTTHRIIFMNKKNNDPMISFSCPFSTLKDVEIEQPVFGANFLRGKVTAQPQGNWVGEVKFKMTFNKGGAVDFGQGMLKAAYLAGKFMRDDAPPAYSPPQGPWYQAPPPAYTPPPDNYGWNVPKNNFPDAPPASSVFMTNNPPPYPGINGYAGYAPPAGFTSAPPQMSSADAKAAEAAQSAYFDPNQPQCAYVPPPAYNDPPPSYQDSHKKMQ